MLIRFAVSCEARSYGEVVQIAMGRTARVLFEICIIVNNAGVLIVYLIIMGDVMSGSVRHIGVLDQWIDSLSMTSAASVAVAVVFIVVCFAVAFIKLIEGKIEAPRRSLDFGSKMAILDLLVVIPIMTNAYVCHFNVQPIYNELEGDCEATSVRGSLFTGTTIWNHVHRAGLLPGVVNNSQATVEAAYYAFSRAYLTINAVA
ncbi:hypothetical protein GOBAR_AA14949 [Gossypium barbadense]|uniref:Amino acid transporter transmembrane domain-containing protein n=1 Tax=Gossypium barbadense TaxID=3634 RepID=A0A2P5XQU8_GOSBA|nr:hypothetical protein GOBAR_AA14949 [Gossypium barbadense]